MHHLLYIEKNYYLEKEKDNKQIFSKRSNLVMKWQHYITPSILFSHSNFEEVREEILFSYLVLFKTDSAGVWTSHETWQHTTSLTTATSANYTQ